MSDVLQLLTSYPYEPSPLQQLKLLQLCMNVVQRAKMGDVPPLSNTAMRSLFTAVANIHKMAFTQTALYNDPYTPLALRLKQVDFALTNIGAEGAANGVATDGMPITFESLNVSLAGFKIAGRLRALMRVPWKNPTEIQLFSIQKSGAVIVETSNTTENGVTDSRIVVQSYSSQNYVQWRQGNIATILSQVLELRIVDGSWSRRHINYNTYAVFHIFLNKDANFSTLGLDGVSQTRRMSNQRRLSAERQDTAFGLRLRN
jgi:hypothetical protein